jgi:hypothetical protein
VVEGIGLENQRSAPRYRGFESHSLRLNSFTAIPHWGGARVVEWGRLLSGYPPLKWIAGSNPVPPAVEDPIRTLGITKTGSRRAAGFRFDGVRRFSHLSIARIVSYSIH